MAVKETQKQPRDVRTMLFVAALILGVLVLGGIVFLLIKPAKPRTVKLTEAQAKEQSKDFNTPAPTLPPAPPLPQAQDPGATLVSLDLKQVTVRQAINEVLKQGKVGLNSDAATPGGLLAAITTPRIDVSIKDQPFWPALLDLCKKGQLTPYSEWNQPKKISFQQGNPNFAQGPMKQVGSSLIILNSVVSTMNAGLTTARAADRDLRVQMQLFVEPKLSPYRISSVATIETAVDENGTNLTRPRDRWDDRDGGGPRSNWLKDVTCRLSFPPNAGNKIAKLKGYASVTIAGPTQTKVIDQPLKAKGVDTTVDSVTVHLIEVRKQGGNNYQVRMAGDWNSPVFRDYERFSKIVALVDANGKELSQNGGSWGQTRGNTMEFGIYFAGASDSSEPKELRITLPSQLKEIRVPFEFSDLPLPH